MRNSSRGTQAKLFERIGKELLTKLFEAHVPFFLLLK